MLVLNSIKPGILLMLVIFLVVGIGMFFAAKVLAEESTHLDYFLFNLLRRHRKNRTMKVGFDPSKTLYFKLLFWLYRSFGIAIILVGVIFFFFFVFS